MAKRKTSKRRYRMITFKVFEDTDSDILDWWEGIDEGERSDALRDLIRAYLGKQPRRNKLLTIPELLEVRRERIGSAKVDAALESLELPVDGECVAAWVSAFIRNE